MSASYAPSIKTTNRYAQHLRQRRRLTRFLYVLWMASSASFIVTPFMFRAVKSMPSGKWRSIFLTGGVVRNSLRMLGSSIVEGDVFIFLWTTSTLVKGPRTEAGEKTQDLPSRPLRLGRDLELDPLLLYVGERVSGGRG